MNIIIAGISSLLILALILSYAINEVIKHRQEIQDLKKGLANLNTYFSKLDIPSSKEVSRLDAGISNARLRLSKLEDANSKTAPETKKNTPKPVINKKPKL